jgi:site-specific DNA recombinase
VELFWTQSRIIRAIRALDRSGISLSAKDFRNDRTEITSKIIYRATKRKVKGSTLYMCARERLGSWRNALAAAGIPHSHHVKHRKYWKPKLVIEAIQALSDAGVSLRGCSLTWDTSSALSGIIFDRTGLSVSGSKLMNGARRQFGTWNAALVAAGVPLESRRWTAPRKTPLTMIWSETQLKEMICQISRKETDLRVCNISRGHIKQVLQDIIFKRYGNLLMLNVIELARNHRGTWRRSVTRSGLDPRFYLKRVRRQRQINLISVSHTVQTEYDREGFPGVRSTTVLRRLRKLEKEGELIRTVSNPYVWTIPEGHAENLGVTPYGPVNRNTLAHEVAVSSVRWALECIGIGQTWTPGHVLRKNAAQSLRSREEQPQAVPDGLFIVSRDGTHCPVALEVELHAKSRSRYRKVLLAYYCKRGLSKLWYVVPHERMGQLKDTNRPELQRLLAAIRNREITLVMVSELSRLSRSIKDFSEIWELMQRSDCGFLSLRESFDTTTAAGEMVLYTVANIAQFERRQVSERVIANIDARAKRGLYNGGVVPLGYKLDPEKKGYLFVDPEQAEIVRKAFRMFLRERSLSQTAKWLNEQGLRYKRQMEGGGRFPRLGHFTITNLKNILTNKSYIGVRVFKSKGEIKETQAVWEPIVEVGAFDQVQEILAKNPKRFLANDPRRHPFLLSGFLVCTQCGERLCGKTANGKNGKFAYYEHAWTLKRQACLGETQSKCDPKRISAGYLEGEVWKSVDELLTDPSVAEQLLQRASFGMVQNPRVGEIEKARAKIMALKAQVETLTDRLSELPKGVPATAIYRKMEALEASRAAEETSLQALQLEDGPRDLPASRELFQKFLESLRGLDDEALALGLKGRIIRRLVQKVEITSTTYRLHFHVGINHVERELAQAGSHPSQGAALPQGADKALPGGSIKGSSRFVVGKNR